MNRLLITLLLALPLWADAQLTNAYRSVSNAHYWKNRKPHTGYWQQDVHYKIDADISEITNIISATEELVYTNNSPHTLTYVYFHLYQNAFVKGSHLEELHRVNQQPIRRMGKYQEQGLGTTVHNMKVNGIGAKTELDNTLLKVYLTTPLKSGESVTFSMDFKTYFDRGDFRRRMAIYNSFGYKHFNGVHWYPRISVYDMRKGWDVDQHLNKELYGNYGLFDVKLTFASNYVVEATGAIQNEAEVLPPDLRAKLDVKNFANKPWGEKPSIITPYDSTQRKTWHYIATNVHDFAFTADPTYRIGETKWNNIRCIAVVCEPHASKWQTASDYVAKIIKTFSEDFGMYDYPKMVQGVQTNLYTMANDGSDIDLVSVFPVSGVNDLDLDFCWNPDGSSILFMSNNKLYTIAPDGSDLSLFSTAPLGSTYTEVDWSGTTGHVLARLTGTEIYNSQFIRYSNIGFQLAIEQADQTGGEGGPDISLLGDKFLYTRDTTGFQSASGRMLESCIFIKNKGGNNQFNASVNKAPGTNDLDARYSANGSQIIFVNTDNTGTGVKNICTIALNGLQRKVIITNGEMPDWQ